MEEKKEQYLLDRWLNKWKNSFLGSALGRAWKNSFWKSVWERMTKSKWGVATVLFFAAYTGVKMGLDKTNGGVIMGALGVVVALLLGVAAFAVQEYYEREAHPK